MKNSLPIKTERCCRATRTRRQSFVGYLLQPYMACSIAIWAFPSLPSSRQVTKRVTEKGQKVQVSHVEPVYYRAWNFKNYISKAVQYWNKGSEGVQREWRPVEINGAHSVTSGSLRSTQFFTCSHFNLKKYKGYSECIDSVTANVGADTCQFTKFFFLPVTRSVQ